MRMQLGLQRPQPRARQPRLQQQRPLFTLAKPPVEVERMRAADQRNIGKQIEQHRERPSPDGQTGTPSSDAFHHLLLARTGVCLGLNFFPPSKVFVNQQASMEAWL